MNLNTFIDESNRIEGINRNATFEEYAVHEMFLELETITIQDVENFVKEVAGAELRCKTGMNVRIGKHRPPIGGANIRADLLGLLHRINQESLTPYEAHHAYETLHPFMDGNGRSGRVIWLWMMQRQLGVDAMDAVYARGFLHSWYYQSLAEGRA